MQFNVTGANYWKYYQRFDFTTFGLLDYIVTIILTLYSFSPQIPLGQWFPADEPFTLTE